MMVRKILIWLVYLLPGLSGCAVSSALDPATAQAALHDAWYAGQHIVWEVDWPQAPAGGPLTVETWRTRQGYRLEILEAVSPALIGQTLIFDGQNAWTFNRFASAPPFKMTAPSLSPVTDAFTIIDRMIAAMPEAAAQRQVHLDHGPAQAIEITFSGSGQETGKLILWRDTKTGLPARILFRIENQEATLKARSLASLEDPLPGLFTPPVEVSE